MLETASIILLRRPAAPEILWMQRTQTARFLSCFHVFPGGHTDARDRAQAPEGDPLGAAKVTALREAFEEVGVYWPALPPARRAAMRAGEIPFAPSPSALASLTYVGTWRTPAFSPWIYQTHFFAAWVDEGVPLEPSPKEVAEFGWARPQEALDRWRAGEVLLVPPTRWALESLVTREAEGVEEMAEIFLRDPRAHDIQPSAAQLHPEVIVYPLRSPTWAPATHTNCVILGRQRPVVVDPGTADEAELAGLYELLDARGGVEAIVLTHQHPDHVIGAPLLAARYGAPILAHPEVNAALEFDCAPIGEGEARFEAATLEGHLTPGHARGHLCFRHAQSGYLIAGDLISGLGSIFVDEMALYLDSLTRMAALDLRCLIPSHGAPIGGARYHLERQRDHRLRREGMLLGALADRPDFEALLRRVYAEVEPKYLAGPDGGLAGRTLRAHLNKLVDEGRVTLEGGRYSAAGSGPAQA